MNSRLYGHRKLVMSLIRIDPQTALNLDAIASIKFSEEGEDISATVNFLSARSQGSSFVSETFVGTAARNLFNLLGATPNGIDCLGGGQFPLHP
jgi:hypothetical protein